MKPETSIGVYLRVSTTSQEHASQKRAVDAFLQGRGLTARYFTDKQSGKTMNRRGLDALQKEIFNGTIKHVVFYSIDRFSRELVAGLVQIDKWTKQGIRLTFVADQLDLDNNGFLTDVILKILVSIKLAFAEHERGRIVDRVRLGLANARAKGVRLGRPNKLSPQTVQDTLARYKGDKVKAAKRLGVSLGTIYNCLKRRAGTAA